MRRSERRKRSMKAESAADSHVNYGTLVDVDVDGGDVYAAARRFGEALNMSRNIVDLLPKLLPLIVQIIEVLLEKPVEDRKRVASMVARLAPEGEHERTRQAVEKLLT